MEDDPTRTATATGGTGPALPDDLAPGVMVGRYRLVEPIGEGGAGIVWAAADPLVGDEVAVKLVPFMHPGAMRQYRRELATLLVLQIPGVVRIRDEGEHGSYVYVVTERIDGRPFSSLCEGRADATTWMPSVLALLDTLARVHLAGVTHADLKPSNILVEADGRPTILDFGLARMRGPGPGHDGVVEGTPRYMAPEQRRGEPVSPRTDLYSVGGMLLEMISGERLASPPDLSRLDAAELPRGLGDQIRRMLAADPGDRPASAMEVLVALDVDPIPDPLRWLGPGPWTVEQLRAFFEDVEESLLHLAEDGAELLFDEAGGDPARTDEVLRRWVRAGDVRWTADGRIEVTRAELERLRARGPDAPETRLATRLADGAEEAEVTAEALATAASLAQEGRPERALGVLEAVALWVRGRPEEAEVLQRRVELQLVRWMPRAIDEAAGAVAVSAVEPGLRAELTTLLRGGRAALVGDVAEARQILETRFSTISGPLRHWRWNLLAFAAERTSLAEHRAVLDLLRADSEVERDFVAMLESKLAYRTGDYDQAAAVAEQAAPAAKRLVVRAQRWTSAAAAWLEVPDWARAIELAHRAGQAAREARAPVIEFQGRWTERVARYRRGEALEPSAAFVDAARAVSLPLEGMAGYIESAIAWRAGLLEEASRISERALNSLRASQQSTLAVLVEGLRCLLGAPGRTAEQIATDAHGIGDDLEVQVLAMVVREFPLARDRLEHLLASLDEHRDDIRLDVLALSECRAALG